MRAQVEKKMAQKEKEKKEEKLRELAQIARDRRAGIKSHGDKGERVITAVVVRFLWVASAELDSEHFPPLHMYHECYRW